jgi:hypothetical protein
MVIAKLPHQYLVSTRGQMETSMSYGYGGGGYPPQGGGYGSGGYPPQGGGYGGGYGNAPAGGGYPPPNHLVWAILSAIFCCPALGIVSIVFAAQVNSKYQAGDYAGAASASKNARLWAIISAIAWVVGVVLYVLFVVVLGITSSTSSSY